MAKKSTKVTDEFDELDANIHEMNAGFTSPSTRSAAGSAIETAGGEEEAAERAPAKRGRASTSRAGMTRGISGRLVNEKKVRQFEEVLNENRIAIPEQVRERFGAAGYHIGWVRFWDNGKGSEDLANLHKKMDKMGFDFVDPTEVPEMSNGYLKKNNEIYGTMVTEGDLALAKIPSEDHDAIIEAKARKTARVSQGIIEPLNSKGIAARQRSFITNGKRRTDEDNEDVGSVLKDTDY